MWYTRLTINDETVSARHVWFWEPDFTSPVALWELINIRVAEFCHYLIPTTGPYTRLIVADVRRKMEGTRTSL